MTTTYRAYEVGNDAFTEYQIPEASEAEMEAAVEARILANFPRVALLKNQGRYQEQLAYEESVLMHYDIVRAS